MNVTDKNRQTIQTDDLRKLAKAFNVVLPEKYLYENESLNKDCTDIGQVLLDIQNHLNDEEKFEYERTILDKKILSLLLIL